MPALPGEIRVRITLGGKERMRLIKIGIGSVDPMVGAVRSNVAAGGFPFASGGCCGEAFWSCKEATRALKRQARYKLQKPNNLPRSMSTVRNAWDRRITFPSQRGAHGLPSSSHCVSYAFLEAYAVTTEKGAPDLANDGLRNAYRLCRTMLTRIRNRRKVTKYMESRGWSSAIAPT